MDLIESYSSMRKTSTSSLPRDLGPLIASIYRSDVVAAGFEDILSCLSLTNCSSRMSVTRFLRFAIDSFVKGFALLILSPSRLDPSFLVRVLEVGLTMRSEFFYCIIIFGGLLLLYYDCLGEAIVTGLPMLFMLPWKVFDSISLAVSPSIEWSVFLMFAAVLANSGSYLY